MINTSTIKMAWCLQVGKRVRMHVSGWMMVTCMEAKTEGLSTWNILKNHTMLRNHRSSNNALLDAWFYVGASGDSVDLLPSPWQADWTKSLPTDDGHLMDQIFSFDGSHNAVEVPAGHIDHHLDNHFTVSTWMKHDFPDGGPVKSHDAPKEHVLCMSDGDGRSKSKLLQCEKNIVSIISMLWSSQLPYPIVGKYVCVCVCVCECCVCVLVFMHHTVGA